MHDQLITLQNNVSAQQPTIDQLIDDSQNARRLVEKSRVNVHRGGPHSDLDRLDTDVNRITQRWNNLCSQLVDRSVSSFQYFITLRIFKLSVVIILCLQHFIIVINVPE